MRGIHFGSQIPTHEKSTKTNDSLNRTPWYPAIKRRQHFSLSRGSYGLLATSLFPCDIR
jgi:hypothetical protein